MLKYIAGAALIAVAACSLDPRNYESAPVTVDTAQGLVTCQLYTKARLDWDRSTNRPDGMSVETADRICKAEGVQRKNSSSEVIEVEEVEPDPAL